MRIAVLFTLLVLATVADLRSHRIPNGIPMSLLLAAVVLGLEAGGIGGLFGVAGGCAVGLCSLLPFYMLGGMGAGDVKLMAGAGALLGGPGAALFAAAAAIIAGGLLGLGYLLVRRLRSSRDDAAHGGAGRRLPVERSQTFPYALAVLTGVLVTLIAAPPWAAIPGAV